MINATFYNNRNKPFEGMLITNDTKDIVPHIKKVYSTQTLRLIWCYINSSIKHYIIVDANDKFLGTVVFWC
jgi:hypothetical protein